MARVRGYLALVALGIALTVFNPITQLATTYNREIALGGTAIYASLRGLSSIMSIVRDADIEASVGVASVATSPGQALQPAIETVERLANLLFAIVVGSGVIGFTLPIIAAIGALMMTAGATCQVALRSISWNLGSTADQIARSLVTLGLFAAVWLPLAYGAAFYLGDRFTSEAWTRAAKTFESQSEALNDPVPQPELRDAQSSPSPDSSGEPDSTPSPTESGNLWDRAKAVFEGAVQGTNTAVQNAATATAGFAEAVRGQFNASTRVVEDGVAVASDLFAASVDIGVAYIVKLIVLPLLLLAGIAWLIRSVGRRSSAARAIAYDADSF